MTVGFHAPLPPAPTGVAHYAAALLPALQQCGSIQVNSSRADVCLYHLGNNRLHREIYARALARPGVVVLHDAVLHHLLLDSPNGVSYVEEFVYNYGEWNRDLAVELWRDRARSAMDPRYFQYAMLRRISEVSRAVIVHNPAAAKVVHAHAPAARVVEIPHLFRAPRLPNGREIIDARQRLGLSLRTFLFAVFGYLRESKRLPVILRAFQKLREADLDASLLIAGEFVSSDLARAIQPMLKQPGVVRVGYTPEREFWTLATAIDACINLRYPSAGETSGITVRLMGIGKPVILSAGGEATRFPETACLRVEHGATEEALLVEYMIWLARFPEAAREIGCRAARHIREHHSLEAVADSYWEVLQSCRD